MLVRGLFGLRRVVRNAEAAVPLQSRLLTSSSIKPEGLSKPSTPVNVDAASTSTLKSKAGPKKAVFKPSSETTAAGGGTNSRVPTGKKPAPRPNNDEDRVRSGESWIDANGFFSTKSKKSPPARRPSSGAESTGSRSSPPAVGQWCEILGFSRYASRFDVESALQHPSVRVHSLHPEVNAVLYPTGKWFVHMELITNGGSGSGGKGAATSTTASASFTQPVELYRVHFMERFSRRINIKQVPHSAKLVLAETMGITACTLRMSVCSAASLEHLKYFLEDYELAVTTKPLRRIMEPPSNSNSSIPSRFSQNMMNSWLVHFRSPAVAQRAYQRLDRKYVLGHPVELFLYS